MCETNDKLCDDDGDECRWCNIYFIFELFHPSNSSSPFVGPRIIVGGQTTVRGTYCTYVYSAAPYKHRLKNEDWRLMMKTERLKARNDENTGTTIPPKKKARATRPSPPAWRRGTSRKGRKRRRERGRMGSVLLGTYMLHRKWMFGTQKRRLDLWLQ